LATAQTPFISYNDDGNLASDIINGKHFETLANNENTPRNYIDLMKKCWELEPTKRPTFQTINNRINEWVSSTKFFSLKRSKTLIEFESADKELRRKSKSTTNPSSSPPTSPLESNDINSENKRILNNKNSSLNRFGSLSSKSLSKYIKQSENNKNVDGINYQYDNHYNNDEDDIKYNDYINSYYGNDEYNNNYNGDNQFSPAFNGHYYYKS